MVSRASASSRRYQCWTRNSAEGIGVSRLARPERRQSAGCFALATSAALMWLKLNFLSHCLEHTAWLLLPLQQHLEALWRQKDTDSGEGGVVGGACQCPVLQCIKSSTGYSACSKLVSCLPNTEAVWRKSETLYLIKHWVFVFILKWLNKVKQCAAQLLDPAQDPLNISSGS